MQCKRFLNQSALLMAALLASSGACWAQGGTILPTDVTGVGVGSPGFPMLQMQMNQMLQQYPQSYYAPRRGVASVRSQAVVIPQSYQTPLLMPNQTLQPGTWFVVPNNIWY